MPLAKIYHPFLLFVLNVKGGGAQKQAPKISQAFLPFFVSLFSLSSIPSYHNHLHDQRSKLLLQSTLLTLFYSANAKVYTNNKYMVEVEVSKEWANNLPQKSKEAVYEEEWVLFVRKMFALQFNRWWLCLLKCGMHLQNAHLQFTNNLTDSLLGYRHQQQNCYYLSREA